MTFNRHAFARVVPSAALLVVLLGGAGCGNYSNEDLEYMNAVPDRSELSADLPVRSAALSPADEAELSRETHTVTIQFNGILSVLDDIEAIRAYQPTSRGPNSRTWGPIPAHQPGWQWKFTVTRTDATPPTFGYVLALQALGDPPDAWIPFVTGSFAASSGARRGVGEFQVETATLRAKGFPFDHDSAKIGSLDVQYSTKDYPISVVMDLVLLSDPTDLTVTNSVHYAYGVQADGQGAMSFTIVGNLVTVTPALETVAVTSRWLATGAGRSEVMIKSGDGAGLSQTECWDTTFKATYNDKPWAPSEDLGSLSACPQIPTL